MDTLTHALSGALLARATASEEPRAIPRRIAAGFFACAAPDLDFVSGYAGPVQYLLNHRGITHSLVLLPLWALALSWLLAKIDRKSTRLNSSHSQISYAVFCLKKKKYQID